MVQLCTDPPGGPTALRPVHPPNVAGSGKLEVTITRYMFPLPQHQDEVSWKTRILVPTYEVHIADMICFCVFDVFIPGCRLFWLAIGLNSHALASMRSKGENYKTEVFRSINEHGCPVLPGKLALFGRELRVS